MKFGDGSSVKIRGKGTIVFGCRNGEQWTLEEVYYIPSLCSNLVSLGQLTESGHKVVIDEDELEVFYKDPCRLIMKVKRSLNRLYKIELNQAIPVCLLSSISDPAWLWHARLGHVNFNALKLLADKKMAGGVPLITHPQQVCQDCLAGKQSRFSFPASTNYRASKPLELIHADLCGPISPATIGGSHYFMLLVDDFSRWMWIYVIKTKDKALLMFDKFKRLVENSPSRLTKCNPTKYPMEPKTHLHKDEKGHPVDASEYRRIIGCLRYLLHTRPDLSFAVGMASRFMERPTVMHHKAVKQTLRYLKGTMHHGLVYGRGGGAEEITGFTDSDMAGDMDDRKSTSGMAFYVNKCLVAWNSQKQKTVALSSCEAEFMAATAAACHALWLRSLLAEIIRAEPKPVKLFVDNKSAIALMKNPVFHGRSKHIDTRFHFIRECVEEGKIMVEFIRTEEQRADSLTKALSAAKLEAMRYLLGVRYLGPLQD